MSLGDARWRPLALLLPPCIWRSKVDANDRDVRITRIAHDLRQSVGRLAKFADQRPAADNPLGWTQRADHSFRLDLAAFKIDDIAELGLDLADTLRTFGRLTLWIDQPTQAKRYRLIEALANAGLQVSGTDRVNNRWLLTAVKMSDWRTLALSNLSDEAFVDAVYWELMERAPDESGRMNYLRELADGKPRDRILRVFLLSGERMEHVAARVVCLDPNEAGAILIRDGPRHLRC